MRRFIVIIAGVAFGIMSIVSISVSEETFIKNTNTNIFQPGRKWSYKTFFIDIKGDTIDSQTVVLKVCEAMWGRQRKIQWRYSKNKIVSSTGVLEDSEVIFLHPPRRGDFRFTELANFPSLLKLRKLCLDEKCQDSTNWKWRKIGGGWKEVVGWDGHLEIEHFGEWSGLVVKHYAEIVCKKAVLTLMRSFSECLQIDTRAESTEGIYKATFYFHPEYGFVRWKYTKPDGEQVILDLEKVSGFEN